MAIHEAKEGTITLTLKSEPEVDSKIASGSKKSAPFMFALAEVEMAMPVYGKDIINDDLLWLCLAAWLRRRKGGVVSAEYPGARMLALCASFALRALADLLDVDHPYKALPEVWKVSLFGEGKHGANNWMSAKSDGMWHYEAALWRHIIESTWEEKAEDSGCYHLAHAVWNALMLLEMEMRGVVNPDWENGDESSN